MVATIKTLGNLSTVGGYGNNRDPNGTEQFASGGQSTALNLTAAQVIKAAPGRVCKIVVISAGTTGGTLTLNDCLTTAAATTANTVFSAGFAALTVGQVITLDYPCAVGIVASAVPTAGSPQYNISFN